LNRLLKEALSLFENQKDKIFKGLLQSIIEAFNEKNLYPGIEEQAAYLWYFIYKKSSFLRWQ